MGTWAHWSHSLGKIVYYRIKQSIRESNKEEILHQRKAVDDSGSSWLSQWVKFSLQNVNVLIHVASRLG